LSRNKGRTGGQSKKPENTGAPVQHMNAPAASEDAPAFSFVVPTEFVDLPSKGRFYPEGHPLHGQDTIEIRQMTAKEEDILTSRTLLKKGIALDRVMRNLICDKSIDHQTLVLGDKNAVVIATRISAYGNIYTTEVECPACGHNQKHSFDLGDLSLRESSGWGDFNVVENDDCTFTTVLPRSKVEVTFKLLNGYDEQKITNFTESDRKKKQEKNVTRQLEGMIVAVNGLEDLKTIRYLVENIPSADSRHLRSVYRMAMPNVDMAQEFECEECDYEQEMEVPLTAQFFWPE
jgi:hypothetical protein